MQFNCLLTTEFHNKYEHIENMNIDSWILENVNYDRLNILKNQTYPYNNEFTPRMPFGYICAFNKLCKKK